MFQLSDYVGLLDGSSKGQTHFHRTSGASGQLATGQCSTGDMVFSVSFYVCISIRDFLLCDNDSMFEWVDLNEYFS